MSPSLSRSQPECMLDQSNQLTQGMHTILQVRRNIACGCFSFLANCIPILHETEVFADGHDVVDELRATTSRVIICCEAQWSKRVWPREAVDVGKTWVAVWVYEQLGLLLPVVSLE